MMLKDIPGMMPALSHTDLAKFSLWQQPAERIIPAQVVAFRASMKLKNQEKLADAIIAVMMYQGRKALEEREVDCLPFLSYTQSPPMTVFTSTALINGLARLSRPVAAAVVFGLETKLPVSSIVMLTRQQVRVMRQGGHLSDRASAIVAKQPIHLHSDYVFWTEGKSKPLPLFQFEQELSDVFNLSWLELNERYANMISTS